MQVSYVLFLCYYLMEKLCMSTILMRATYELIYFRYLMDPNWPTLTIDLNGRDLHFKEMRVPVVT